MGEEINFNDFERYWSPVPNTEVTAVLGNWRKTTKVFNGKEKITLVFDVFSVDDQEYDNPLEYSTTGGNALKYKDAIQNANKRNEDTITVRILCAGDKKINVVDMKLVNKIIRGVESKKYR